MSLIYKAEDHKKSNKTDTSQFGKYLGKLGAIAGGLLGSVGGPAGTVIGSAAGGALGLFGGESGKDQYLKQMTDKEQWMPLTSASMGGGAFNWTNPAVNPMLERMGFGGEAGRALEDEYEKEQKRQAIMSMLTAGI
tara:strand:+ start:5070 stop:5477 length:408 start_codon:yes stop_codon:yes gene_type:complete